MHIAMPVRSKRSLSTKHNILELVSIPNDLLKQTYDNMVYGFCLELQAIT